jgi:hypothetical protein
MTPRLGILAGFAAALVAGLGAAARAQSSPAQGTRVALAGSCDGRALFFEVRTTPGAPVMVGVATARTPDSEWLSFDDPLMIASINEPALRGVAGPAGTVRLRVPIDVAILDRLPPVVYAQAARLLPNGVSADHSEVVAIDVLRPTAPGASALGWLAGAAAGLILLFLLPAPARRRAARGVAVAALIALPLLLARVYGGSLFQTPHVPFGGDPDGALVAKLGSEAVSELMALNAALPESQPVIVVTTPELGPDLLLRRLFAKRPYSTVPGLPYLEGTARIMGPQAVVVTFDGFRPPGAQDVFEARSFRAWRRP